MPNQTATLMCLALILATVVISLYARRFNQSTAEFYLAGRQVGFVANASAICGDYFSAASFLGVAAATYAGGLDGAWFGAGFGAGFVPVVLFFASPLRRFGEYTLPDFLTARFQSPTIRVTAVALVQVICLLYLIPQMFAVGKLWEILVGPGLFGMSAYETGVVVSAALMLFYTAIGGMRGTTWNQIIQFWVLFTAMLLVVVLALVYGWQYRLAVREISQGQLVAPAVYRVRDLPLDEARAVMSPAYWESQVAPKLSDPDAEVAVLMPMKSKLDGRSLRFTEPGSRYNWLTQFSVVLTLVVGTSGLPHIMNRFYTNPSGPIARVTTVYILVFVALFYLLASTAGLMGRALVPALAAGLPDLSTFGPAIDGVLAHPDGLVPFLAQSLGGSAALGYVTAGALAAALSTMGGLLIASAASWGHDLYEKYIDPAAPEWRKVAVGRAAVVVMSLLGLVAGIVVPGLGLDRTHPELIALMVTWAFGVAGGGFFPAVFMGIWWKRTTTRGALAGMWVGGFGSALFILGNVLDITWPGAPAWLHTMGQLTFPAIVTVPMAFLAIWAISLADQRSLPENIDAIWARIHGTAKERMELRREAWSKAQGGA